MRTLFLALAMVSLSATPSFAAPCKDAKGKFVKCPDKKPARGDSLQWTPRASS